MSFRTIVEIPTSSNNINHQQKILMLGSCFTENIGERLQKAKFSLQINPFGILYNPLSIQQSLNYLINAKQFTPKELTFHNEQWVSFAHHGDFSHPEQEQCLQRINETLSQAQIFLKNANWLIITLGTAYAYILKNTGEIVANCHKFPHQQFDRKRANVSDIVSHLKMTIQELQTLNPSLNILFTVSPIRHWKDGAIANQLSKATLLLAIEHLKNDCENIHYFPAYELVMDDLRDYRFYEADMLHPNSVAIDYIWQCFQNTYFNATTLEVLKAVQKVQMARQHRPLRPESRAHRQFLHQQLAHLQLLKAKYPFLNVEEEEKYFKKL